MEQGKSELFTGQDFEDFTNWLNLKDFTEKWDARVQQELEKFYLLFLSGTQTIEDYRFKKNSINFLFNEPLRRWFDWFLDKYGLYQCVFRNVPILEVVNQFELDLSIFLTAIYDHFSELNLKFKKDLLTEDYIYSHPELKIKQICFNEEDFFLLKESCKRHPVYSSLDFTFYPEWKKCLDKLHTLNKSIGKKKELKSKNLLKSLSYEFFFIFISIGLALAVFKVGNKIYNSYLANKIEIYEPNFFWLDKDLAYKENTNQPTQINLASNEMEKLEKVESKTTPFIQEKREDPESEVYVLTSDNIPKDLKYVSQEKSRYEEIKKGGFRDKIYGRRKTYRVILNSVEMNNLKQKIKDITFRYKIKGFGKVALGQEIPGGSYFNLYVKEVELNDFLEEVVALDESSRLYVSKTNSEEMPEGYEKVFIWIKSI